MIILLTSESILLRSGGLECGISFWSLWKCILKVIFFFCIACIFLLCVMDVSSFLSGIYGRSSCDEFWTCLVRILLYSLNYCVYCFGWFGWELKKCDFIFLNKFTSWYLNKYCRKKFKNAKAEDLYGLNMS